MDVARSALLSRKSEKREQEAACGMLAALFVALGSDAEDPWGDAADALRHCARDGKAKGAATAAFALGAFVCSGTGRGAGWTGCGASEHSPRPGLEQPRGAGADLRRRRSSA